MIDTGLGDFLFGLFSGMDEQWAVLCIFVLFLIDAILFPTLPELFIILALNKNPTPLFGTELIVAAVVGELIGIFSLYFVIKKISLPARIKNVAEKYVNFLIVSDEKALLINRIAPMIPFAGAFIAIIDSWNPKKCIFYIVSGCVIKYGILLAASGFFLTYFSGNTAQTVTLIFVFGTIIISFIAQFIRKKKAGLDE